MEKIQVDIAIVGGGIAGLWALNVLKARGFSVALLEKTSLGGGQTVCSQGIIHGGMKYALTGSLTKDAQELIGVPDLWRQCLQNKDTITKDASVAANIADGMLDLTATKILAEGQYLFSTGSLATNISSFFASKTLRSAVESLPRAQYPAMLQNAAYKGQVYKLAELVLDVPSLVHNLAQLCWDNIIKVDFCSAHYAPDNNIDHLQLRINGEQQMLTAQQYVFLAGSGNQELLHAAHGGSHGDNNVPKLQLRPLHMVYVKAPGLTPLYAHCIGLSATPRITITTHVAHGGCPVWYLGGALAEDGVAREQEQQIAFAQQELSQLFPWLDLTNAQWGSLRIDRAEALRVDGKKPTAATLFTYANVNVGWPTKLAFSPLLARQISAKITAAGTIPGGSVGGVLAEFAKPEIAKYPWD